MNDTNAQAGTGVTKPKRVYRGSTDDQRRKARKKQLIDAAILVYAEKGYHNASVKAVCVAAGLTERYFYESFANSEALLIGSYKAVTKFIIEAAEEAAGIGSETVEKRIGGWLTEYFRLVHDEPATATVFLADFGSISKATSDVFTESLNRFGASLFRLLDGEPCARSKDEAMLMRGVVGGLHHIALAWIREGYARSPERVIALSRQLILRSWKVGF